MVNRVESPVVGTVWKIDVAIGESVGEGDVIVILESMKMEIPVEAETAGTIAEILVEEGDAVAEGDSLAVIAPPDTADG